MSGVTTDEKPVTDEPPGGTSDIYQKQRKKLREKLSSLGPQFKYADLVLVAPDLLHLIGRLTIDPRVRPAQKAKLAATLAYFVFPLNLVPTALVGPLGYIDDLALAAYVLNGMLNSDEAPLVREHWAGDKDILKVVQSVLEVADSAIGSGLWRRIKGVRLPRFR